jgi:hypothetical protein
LRRPVCSGVVPLLHQCREVDAHDAPEGLMV